MRNPSLPDSAVAELRRTHSVIYNNPRAFIRRELGRDLWWAQERAINLLRDNNRVAIASANACGKSFLAAVTIPWYLMSRPLGYVVTTASSWTGLEKILWPELHRVLKGAPNKDIANLGQLNLMEWKIAPQWGAFPVSPKEPENFGGFRTPHGVYVIVDEASALSYDMMEAIEGVCSSAGSKVLLIGNPLRPTGPFYDAFRSSNWATMNISAFDSPNYRTGRNLVPGLATREWVEARRTDWGEESPAWCARVVGQFPESSEDAVISLRMVEEAIARSKDAEVDEDVPIDLGVDVARFGDDATIIQPVQGRIAYVPRKMRKQDTMSVVGAVVDAIRELNPRRVNIDDIGVGGGVVDRLHEMGYYQCVGVNVAEAARDTERYINIRAEAWFCMKDWLRTAVLPNDRDLVSALTAPKYRITSTGKIKLEPKEETKKRLHRSPDEADALVLATMTPYNHVEMW